MQRLLLRRGLVGDATESEPKTALERWFLSASQERARLAAVDEQGRPRPRAPQHPWRARDEDTSTGLSMGFSTHARVSVRAGDKEGRERLCQYVARPPFAAEQLSELEDGRVAFELSHARRTGQTHVVLTPEQWLRRIAWLIPPPRTHLLRYYGVLGPRAKLRREVVPPPEALTGVPVPPPNALPELSSAPARREAASDWAKLLARVWRVDVETCPRCGAGPMRPIAPITDPKVIPQILEHLGLPWRVPAANPARGPP